MCTTMYDGLLYDIVSEDEVEDALKIEQQGFPPNESATLEAFRFRQSKAKDLFLGVYLSKDFTSRELIGYVCSTLSPAESLTHESMSTHVPSSTSVCIHAICVSPHHRRQGVGSRLLREYVSRLEQARTDAALYERILLITHEELRPFYEECGFEWVGRSEVVHGSRPWFEMRKNLGSPVPSHGRMPPGSQEALQQSPRSRPHIRLLSSFSGGIADVLVSNQDSQVNKFDLLCPRNECGSVILKHGVAKRVERSSVQMESPEAQPHPLLPSLPPVPETTQWWLITPSPMAFENMGFLCSIPSQVQAVDKKLKLLTCAECDLGPLGWSEEGGTEFWLACSRVGYGQ